jgi:very-short-patch-repair endonuclease
MLTNKVIRYQKIDKAKIQQAKELRRIMTPAEKVVWDHVRNGRICGIKVRRQQVIEGFIVDFYCNKARLVIEIDGNIHTTGEQKEYDQQRKKVLEAHGLSEMRFTNDEVMNNITHVVSIITEAVSKRTSGVNRASKQ